MMNSIFLNQLNKINLYNNISKFVLLLEEKINNGNINKLNTNISWFLVNTLELLDNYNIDYKELNLLNDNEYQNILNTITKILNKNYYGIT